MDKKEPESVSISGSVKIGSATSSGKITINPKTGKLQIIIDGKVMGDKE